MAEAKPKLSDDPQILALGSFTRRIFQASSLLMARQAIIQLIGAVTGVLIARWASPEDFGYYAIFSFFFYLLLSPGDLGLGASLVRQLSTPKLEECRNVLAVRHLVDLLLLSFVWLLAPHISSAYEMAEPHGTMALRLMAVAAFIQSFQIIPNVLLERELKFGAISFIEVSQALVYSALALTLTVEGWGALGFACAWVAFSATGAMLSLLIKPWSIGWRFNSSFLKSRLPFSLPYQASGALSLGKDAVTPVLVGILLGASQVGYINWAQMLAMIAALAVMVLQRVFFSVFTKIQDNLPELGKMVELAIRLAHGFSIFPALLILVLAEPITAIVFGSDWLVALPIFYTLWPANLIAPTLQPVIAALHALGHSPRVLKINFALTVAFWLASVPLILNFGTAGYAPAFLAYYALNLWLIVALKNLDVKFSITKAVFPIWLCSIVASFAAYTTQQALSDATFTTLLISCVTGGMVYVSLVFMLRNKLITKELL